MPEELRFLKTSAKNWGEKSSYVVPLGEVTFPSLLKL
jgi:hypothetical protein